MSTLSSSISHRFLYTLLHTLYSLYLILSSVFSQPLLAWSSFFASSGTTTLSFVLPPSPFSIQTQTLRLSNLPSHLAVLFHTLDSKTDDWTRDVARLTCWCLAAGIERVTVYDADGKLKRDLLAIQSTLSLETKRFFTLEKCYQDEKIKVTHHWNKERNGSRGFQMSWPGRSIQVDLVSSEDGRRQIVQAAQQMCYRVSQGEVTMDEISPIYLNKVIAESSIPDPQLLIVVGPRLTLDGFPPWQLRLTEIFHVPHTRHLSYFLFIQALRKYSNCNMRFGH